MNLEINHQESNLANRLALPIKRVAERKHNITLCLNWRSGRIVLNQSACKDVDRVPLLTVKRTFKGVFVFEPHGTMCHPCHGIVSVRATALYTTLRDLCVNAIHDAIGQQPVIEERSLYY